MTSEQAFARLERAEGPLASLPLSHAVLCLEDDETIFRVEAGVCPICGGQRFMPLATWLKSMKARP